MSIRSYSDLWVAMEIPACLPTKAGFRENDEDNVSQNGRKSSKSGTKAFLSLRSSLLPKVNLSENAIKSSQKRSPPGSLHAVGMG